LKIYEITKEFPKEEIYALVSQLRRAAYSVMANIAEGNERYGYKDRLNFFNIAKGSLVEIDCLLDLAKSLNYINEQTYSDILEKINKTVYLLNQFISSQQSQNS
jgi:four helix bundle protein